MNNINFRDNNQLGALLLTASLVCINPFFVLFYNAFSVCLLI
jgi:hypothetical protein